MEWGDCYSDYILLSIKVHVACDSHYNAKAVNYHALGKYYNSIVDNHAMGVKDYVIS